MSENTNKVNGRIGILYTDAAGNGLTHTFFSGIVDSVKRSVEQKGYTVCFLNSEKENPIHKPYLQQVVDNEIVGVAIVCEEYDNPEVVELIESGIPIVTVDHEIEGITNITSNNEKGIRDMVEYLLERGHKRIAYIMGQPSYVTKVREKAFVSTCMKDGIEINTDFMISSYFCDMRKAAYYTEELLRLPEPPSCIIYSDDYAAIGGINIIHARGLEIPHDISIVGYDGLKIVGEFEPKLTTVVQNTKEIGRIAGEKLVEAITSPETYKPETVLVDTTFDQGRTVAKVYY